MENKIETWTEEKIRRRTFFSFAAFAVLGASGVGAWRWFRGQAKTDKRLSALSRKVLNFNEKVNTQLFNEGQLAPVYPKSMAALKPRSNGKDGLRTPINLDEWRLQVDGLNGTDKIAFTIADIKTLPKQELIFDFKCVEGWNQIVHYGGVKFSDFLEKYNLGINPETKKPFQYVGLTTPDGKYYVGVDMKSILHSQTLLAFELNGQPLSDKHGSPLRLITPLKYGVKNLKRIGRLFFSDTPPPDFWHRQGYDYDLAL
jgi:DMSO/TMAO reductase YedYZ molybdopterin-dependent catalytic subunit